MQQADMTKLIHATIANSQTQKSAEKTGSINKKPRNKMLNAAKEIGITAGMGVAGGVLTGGIASLIPTKNTERISNVLCDTFIKAAETNKNPDEIKNLNINLNNIKEQLQKAKEYISSVKIFDNAGLSDEEMKTAGKNLSDSAWALKESAISYMEKTAKGDNLLKFAKKEARKMRTKELMSSSIKTGIVAAFLVLLFNTTSGMFNKNSDKNNQ